MNLIVNKKIIKILMSIVIFIMISGFVLPNYSLADVDEQWGGKLFKPVANFFALIPDLVINLLQEFLWDGSNVGSDGKIYIRTSSNIYRKNTTA